MTSHRPALRSARAALAVLAAAASSALPASAQEAAPPASRQEAPPGQPPAPVVPGRPGPDGTPPEAVVLPEQTERNRIISGSPLTTGTRPEDTATTTEVPVNPGLDGDAPSDAPPMPDDSPGQEAAPPDAQGDAERPEGDGR